MNKANCIDLFNDLTKHTLNSRGILFDESVWGGDTAQCAQDWINNIKYTIEIP
jgi:hypothetical protein